MTVNEALIVCGILKKHGYGDIVLTVECGYTSVGCYPDYLHIQHGYINMEGGKFNGKWNVADKTLIPVCEEIETALLEVEKSKRITNGDKIRSMTDEELSDFINVVTDCCSDGDICEKCPLYSVGSHCNIFTVEKWLKQEAKDDAD